MFRMWTGYSERGRIYIKGKQDVSRNYLATEGLQVLLIQHSTATQKDQQCQRKNRQR